VLDWAAEYTLFDPIGSSSNGIEERDLEHTPR
jgi:hypothetical protein